MNHSQRHYYTPVIVQMTPEDLRELIINAMHEGAQAVRDELRHQPQEAPRTITGRKEIMSFLGIRSDSTLRQRMNDFPEAFTSEGRSTLILDTVIFSDLKKRAEKMTRHANRSDNGTNNGRNGLPQARRLPPERSHPTARSIL